MKKEILVKEIPFEDAVEQVLVADDVNAYELILNTKEDLTDCTFEVTAIRSDGQTVTDTGSVEGNIAKYLLKNSMYAVPGKLVIRLRVASADGSILTTKILNFTVIEGSGAEDAVTAVDNYPVLTKLIVDTKAVLERAEAVTEIAENIVNNIPVLIKNKNTIVTKDGNHVIDENSNDAFVVGADNELKNGDNSVIFGHENIVDGESNIVSGSHNTVKGLHNLVVGNKLNVTDDGTAQVIFGLGNNVPISKDVAIAYYNLGKKTFEVLKDGTLTLNDEKITSMPACAPKGGDYILECNTTNNTYGIECLQTRGGTQYCYRLVVSKSDVPEITESWAGHTIEWTHINDDGTTSVESAIIREVAERTDNPPNHWNIDFDKIISNFDSDTEAKEYWDSFTIKGANYNWKAKTHLLEEIKEYLNN